MDRSTSARPGKIKKEEVDLLFLRVEFFEKSYKGEGGSIPFYLNLPHTVYILVVSLFVDPVQGSSFTG